MTRNKFVKILADPDFMNRVNHLKKSPMYKGCSEEFITVVQLVFEAFIHESIEKWKTEFAKSLKQKRDPVFHSFVSLDIETSGKTYHYKRQVKKVISMMFNLSAAELDLFDEVFSLNFDESNDPYRPTHVEIGKWVAEEIEILLNNAGVTKYVIVHSGIGVSVFDKVQHEKNREIIAGMLYTMMSKN